MTGILMAGVLGAAVVACVRAVLSVRLLERDREAWERLQQAEQERRRRRQELIGNVLLQGIRFVSDFKKKNEGGQ